MRWIGIGIVVIAVFAGVAAARDKKAEQFHRKGVQLSKTCSAAYKTFILSRDTFTDEQLKTLIHDYEAAAELLHASLEVEDFTGINGQIILIAKRLAKLRFEEIRRHAARNPKPKPKPKSKPKSDPKPKEPSKPVDPPLEEDPVGSKTADPEPSENFTRRQPWPELIEDKKEVRRGKQTLRNFLMHYYFANRKFATLISRCTRCNGRSRIMIGRVPKTRKPIMADCPRCHGTGGHLNLTAARKAYWLTMSPLHRSDPGNRANFNEKLESWRKDPRLIGEFLKSLSIKKIDYHGLWAVVQYQERATILTDGRQIPLKRNVQRMFLRLGKRWFVYDEKSDQDFFTPDD